MTPLKDTIYRKMSGRHKMEYGSEFGLSSGDSMVDYSGVCGDSSRCGVIGCCLYCFKPTINGKGSHMDDCPNKPHKIQRTIDDCYGFYVKEIYSDAEKSVKELYKVVESVGVSRYDDADILPMHFGVRCEECMCYIPVVGCSCEVCDYSRSMCKHCDLVKNSIKQPLPPPPSTAESEESAELSDLSDTDSEISYKTLKARSHRYHTEVIMLKRELKLRKY